MNHPCPNNGDMPNQTGAPIGVLSGVCNMNPYTGKQYTAFRESEGGINEMDYIGAQNCPGPSSCELSIFWCT